MILDSEAGALWVAYEILGKAKRAKSEAMNSRSGLGEAALLEREALAFLAGVKRDVPLKWKWAVDAWNALKERENDPEYVEYLRLREKFHG